MLNECTFSTNCHCSAEAPKPIARLMRQRVGQMRKVLPFCYPSITCWTWIAGPLAILESINVGVKRER